MGVDYFGNYFPDGGPDTTASTAVGRYTTGTKLIQFLGQFNIDVLGDVDGDGAQDVGAIEQAIITAEATVDFRTGGPWTFTADTVAAGMLEKWSRYLAAVEVAQKRLGIDAKQIEALRTLRQEAYDEMKLFRDGSLQLPGIVSDDDGVTSPLEALAALSPARGKLRCVTTTEVLEELRGGWCE